MNSKQKELDSFTSKGKHLLSELKKIHSGDFSLVKTDMESTLDKWLDVRAPPGVREWLAHRFLSQTRRGLTKEQNSTWTF
jgi:hypothetical protein